MKRAKLKEIEEAINSNSDDSKYRDLLYKNLKISSLSILILSLLMFIFSLFLKDSASLLSAISPKVYFIIMIPFIIWLVVTVLLSTLFKDKLSDKKLLLYYKFFDTTSFFITILTFLMFLFMFIASPTTVVGGSMNNTLASGDRVVVWHLGYEPKRDDIVVAHIANKYGNSDDILIIKRVVAVSGDKVELKNNALYVNDNLVSKYSGITSRFTNLITDKTNDEGVDENLTVFVVPDSKCILLGDNRPVSNDSRNMGLIDYSDIVGKALFRILPLKSFGKISDDIIDK